MSGFISNATSHGDLWGLLNVMADPVAYKQKLTQIYEVETRLDAKIALAGHADQILALRDVAAKNHEAAIEKLTAAEKRAIEITKAAEERAKADLAAANVKIEQAQKTAQKCLEDGKTEANAIITQACAKADADKAKLIELQNEVHKKEKSVKEKVELYDGLVAGVEDILTQNSAEQERLAVLIAQTEALRQEAIDKDQAHQEAFALFLEEHTKAYERYAAIKQATDGK